jgi:hypothetical protein
MSYGDWDDAISRVKAIGFRPNHHADRFPDVPELHDIVSLILIGLFAGLIGGMLGVGGSVVMIPAMTEVLGPDQHLYQAAAMIVNLFVAVPAVVQHQRAGAIDRGTVARLIPLTALAVIGGVLLSELSFFHGTGERRLRALFGMFLLLAASADLFRLARRRFTMPRSDSVTSQEEHDARTTGNPAGPAETGERSRGIGWWAAAAIALPTGLIAGLLGVGGGLVAVPLQRRVLGVPIRNAIANSASIIIATSFLGAALKNFAYVRSHPDNGQSFVLALLLIPTAILGSMLGSRLTHIAPLDVVKGAFFVLLSVAALRMVFGAG